MAEREQGREGQEIRQQRLAATNADGTEHQVTSTEINLATLSRGLKIFRLSAPKIPSLGLTASFNN